MSKDAKKPGSGVTTVDGTNLPATTPKKKSAFLDAIRASKAPGKAVAAPRPDRAEMLAAAIAGTAVSGAARRPRLVFGVDATASREPAWSAAKETTDALFAAIPGALDVALAVHGASELHTFTDFVSDASKLRDEAASIRCRAGRTRMIDILDRARDAADVKVVLYVGDVFEEAADDAYAVADALKLKGCRVIVLHDRGDRDDRSAAVFQEIARRTGGAVLPFRASAVSKLRDLLAAVGVLAVGGLRLLKEKQQALPGATLLLQHLSGGEGKG